MEEYAGLLKLGFVVALVLLVGLVLRLMGFGKKDKAGKGKSKKKAEKEKFFKQDAYVDHGGDGGEWEDSDMYAMKEGKASSKGMFDDVVQDGKKSKKMESWEDY
ncbi:MAG: hypothetical protein HOL66_16240 [Rhodospirillaceae bacterium]|jgi:hypothetical protein|nr:hypothetical protein [Rhodospirillaceae bacterium]MBT5245785.1 hypothetical protein [Rhodospirillaceae bacterium]MBT5561628.1 hypothetical protein [Rhodospirillaceae bacterium]MBT6241776.1 hypothetical protein [Rhodospirillaceae bacterium]MBT7136776.1 hypothetical protein [Rhodospirillaceae bacterium]